MNDLPLVAYLVLATFVLCWVGGVISWCFAAYYMFKVMPRFRPGREWGRYVPFSIFSSWFFTDDGNLFRAKLLKSGSLFVLFVALGAAIGLGFEVFTNR